MLKKKQTAAISFVAFVSLIHLSKTPENNDEYASAKPHIIPLTSLGPGTAAIR